jgi:hypothetical protein
VSSGAPPARAANAPRPARQTNEADATKTDRLAAGAAAVVNRGWSSCGAQMFLDSGDGLVFKGTGGPWYSESTNSYHLSESAARTLIERAVASYIERAGAPPRELFIHGKARFDDDEWRGLTSGAPSATEVVGVRIRHAEDLRVYRPERRRCCERSPISATSGRRSSGRRDSSRGCGRIPGVRFRKAC